MAGPSSSTSAAEWLNAAPGAAEKNQSGGFGGGGAAIGGGDGESDLKQNSDGGGNNGTGGGRDACGGDGGLKSSRSRIGVDQCQCDCGEVNRKPRMELCDDLDDDDEG